MKTQEFVSGVWLQCSSNYDPKHSIYKLHAAIPVEDFDKHYRNIYFLLKKSVEDGVIPAFKILNIGGSAKIKEAIGDKEATFQENPNVRLANNPFTIYLHEDFNPHQLTDLCQQIEALLKTASPVRQGHLSPADIELSAHLTFRQATLNGQYVAVGEASPETIALLKTQAEESSKYKKLRETLALRQKPEKASEKDDPAVRQENFIQGFYLNEFPFYKRGLESQDINKQFIACCEFLTIDPEVLKNESKEAWEKIINRKSRQIGLRFHPDKSLNKNLETTNERATEIFQLLGAAASILKKIAENPSVLNKEKILEQEQHRPAHQYQLAESYNDDPYFYIGMARSDRQYVLIQNWEFSYQAETVANPNEEGKAENTVTTLQVYTPKLQLQRKTIALPGYEAFYHLFMAHALPRRFDQGHFRATLPDAPFNEGQKWLVKKVLTTPDFIGFMDTFDFVRLAIAATEQGLIQIGTNVNEIFLYYYNNFPDTLYSKRIRRLFEHPKGGEKSVLERWIFDPEVVAAGILKNPDRLLSLSDHILTQITYRVKDIKPYIFAKKKLTQHFELYHLEELLKPLIKAKKLDVLTEMALQQLLLGSHDFIALFSTQKLQALIEYIHANKDDIPSWLADEVQTELTSRTSINSLERVLNPREEYFQKYKTRINTQDFIKMNFIRDDTNVVYALNRETLLWLAAQPEVHWSRYLFIAHALILLGESLTAARYLNRVAEELRISTEALSPQALLEKIIHHQVGDQQANVPTQAAAAHAEAKEFKLDLAANEALNQLCKKWEQEQLKKLLNDYEKALADGSSATANEVTAIKQQIDLLGGKEEQSKIFSVEFDRYSKKYGQLLDAIQEGTDPRKLQDEATHLKIALERMGVKIDWFEQHGPNGRHFFGNQMFTLVEWIVNVRRAGPLHSGPAKPMFGIDPSAKTLECLERAFNIYKLFGQEQEFYQHLASHTFQNPALSSPEQQDEKSAEATPKASEFNRRAVTNHLLKYLDNEFAVFIEGSRKAAPYKMHRFIDHQDVKPFEPLASLYKRMGEEEHLKGLLPHAYGKLLDLEKEQPGAGLAKYLAIRSQLKVPHTVLEYLAVQTLLVQIVERHFGRLEKTLLPSANNRAAEFSDKISALRPWDSPLMRAEKLTQNILGLMATFLSRYADSPLYNDFLRDLKNTSILSEYLSLSDLDGKAVPTAKTAEALVAAINTPRPVHEPLKIMWVNEQKQAPQPAAIERKEESYSEEGSRYASKTLIRFKTTIINTAWELGALGGHIIETTWGQNKKVPFGVKEIFDVIKSTEATGKWCECLVSLEIIAQKGVSRKHSVFNIQHSSVKKFYEEVVREVKEFKQAFPEQAKRKPEEESRFGKGR